MRSVRVALTAAQAAAAALALRRLARGRHREPPLMLGTSAPPPDGRISILIPARGEAERIGPCLAGALPDPDVEEVLVVVDDDESDATPRIAAAAGARVIRAPALPAGWVGKPWACQRGLEEARGEYVVALDADTRPRPGLARALVARLHCAQHVACEDRDDVLHLCSASFRPTR